MEKAVLKARVLKQIAVRALMRVRVMAMGMKRVARTHKIWIRTLMVQV